jgi:hypothetical protein
MTKKLPTFGQLLNDKAKKKKKDEDDIPMNAPTMKGDKKMHNELHKNIQKCKN